jgi:seryl-tRNA synthetase
MESDMLDPKRLRNDLENIAAQLARRGFELDTARFSRLEERRKVLQTRTQELQSQRNERSKAIGQAKARGEDIEPLKAEVADLGDQLKSAETEFDSVQAELDELLMGVPNVPEASVPQGEDDEDNEEIRRWGQQPEFDFTPRDHVDLGAPHGWSPARALWSCAVPWLDCTAR